MKKTLVTGATGFIGANLARRLIKDGHQTHILVRPKHEKWRINNIGSEVKIHSVDISDRDSVVKTIKKIAPDWYFHLAAHGAYAHQDNFQHIVRTNVQGIDNLLEGALSVGFESFINVGSSSEYGFKDHAPKESEALDPNSYYAITKAYASFLCRHTSIHQKVNIITLRPYSVFGPFEEPTRLLPTLIINGLEGKLPPLVNPDIARDFIYVDDFLEACLLTASSKIDERGRIYNVGSEVQTTLKEVVEAAQECLKIDETPKWGSLKNRKWDTNTWVSDSQKIKKDLGFVAKTDFKSGFVKFAEWFKENPSQFEYYRNTINQFQVS